MLSFHFLSFITARTRMVQCVCQVAYYLKLFVSLGLSGPGQLISQGTGE